MQPFPAAPAAPGGALVCNGGGRSDGVRDGGAGDVGRGPHPHAVAGSARPCAGAWAAGPLLRRRAGGGQHRSRHPGSAVLGSPGPAVGRARPGTGPTARQRTAGRPGGRRLRQGGAGAGTGPGRGVPVRSDSGATAGRRPLAGGSSRGTSPVPAAAAPDRPAPGLRAAHGATVSAHGDASSHAGTPGTGRHGRVHRSAGTGRMPEGCSGVMAGSREGALFGAGRLPRGRGWGVSRVPPGEAAECSNRRSGRPAPDMAEGRSRTSPEPALTCDCHQSGRQDLNLRPLDPQSSALPSCATSRCPCDLGFPRSHVQEHHTALGSVLAHLASSSRCDREASSRCAREASSRCAREAHLTSSPLEVAESSA